MNKAAASTDWALRVPEAEAMNDEADNAAFERIAVRWLVPAVYPAMLKALGSQESLRSVLDAGSGTGRLAIAVARARPGTAIVGADLSAAMLKHAQANALAAGVAGRVLFTRQNLVRTGFVSGAFDAAVSYGSLHHWTAPAAVCAELARVVRPGGLILIGDWRRDPAPLRFFHQQQGTPEWCLIEASARAAYLEDELESLLVPLANLVDWHVRRHAMGLLASGQVRPPENVCAPVTPRAEHCDAGT